MKNTGVVRGDEVVQLYVKNPNDDKEIKALKGFKRISLDPGETKTVEFNLGKEALQSYEEGKGFVVGTGDYTIYAGPSSTDSDLKELTLKVIN